MMQSVFKIRDLILHRYSTYYDKTKQVEADKYFILGIE